MPEYSNSFVKAFEFSVGPDTTVLHDPLDLGSEERTAWGLSAKRYPEINVTNLTREDAREIYWQDWWVRYGFDKLTNEAVARKLFDLSINIGIKRTSLLLQKCLNKVWGAGLVINGEMDALTLSAVNRIESTDESTMLYIALCHYAASFYEQLNNPRYEKGWLRRAFS